MAKTSGLLGHTPSSPVSSRIIGAGSGESSFSFYLFSPGFREPRSRPHANPLTKKRKALLVMTKRIILTNFDKLVRSSQISQTFCGIMQETTRTAFKNTATILNKPIDKYIRNKCLITWPKLSTMENIISASMKKMSNGTYYRRNFENHFEIGRNGLKFKF